MIVREGWPFILIGSFVTVALVWVAVKWDYWPAFASGTVLAVLTLFVVFFFRDPERTIIDEPNILLSAADGRVVAIDTIQSHPFLGSEAVRVSVFLSVFDVHVNRVPSNGRINYVKYHPGKFFPAFVDKASDKNERTEIGLTTPSGQRIVFTQIAGIIARRIVCRLKADDEVVAGDRFGMIRFGSRTDIIVPLDTRLLVKKGDRVKGGESVIGYLSGKPTEIRPDDSIEESSARL